MKKIILSSILAATSLFAITDEEILSIYGNAPAGVEIKVSERVPVKEIKDCEAVFIGIFSKGELAQEDLLFVKDDLILPDIIDVKNKTFYKEKIQKNRTYKNIAKLYEKELPENIIKIGNDEKKPTMLIFTDAECPYCRREMSVIEERLKSYNIEIIMTSVHKESGHAKSFLIYKEMKDAKTDADKIKILTKYYDEKMGPQISKVTQDDIKKAEKLALKYQTSGVNAVPFIVDKAEVLNSLK